MINGLHRAGLLLVVSLLHFCSPTDMLNALADRNGITLTRSVAYADPSVGLLDIYAPRTGGGPAPVVVFFYGGGFRQGSRDWYRFVGATLAAHGIVVVIPDYRHYPPVRFPAFMGDAARAVGWARANIGRFGGDPGRLFLMGHSAGGQIAALLALDGEYLASVHLSPRDLCGVIGLAGAYDYTPADPSAYAAIFGPPATWPRSRPIAFVAPHAPPMLLLAGRADSVVEPGNTVRLAARLREAGDPVTVELYSGMTHAAVMAAMSDALAFLAPVRSSALRFIAAQAGCGIGGQG